MTNASSRKNSTGIGVANAANITLHGPLGERYRGNIDYLLWRYQDVDRLLFPFEHRDQWCRISDWDGEYAGKWLDAAVLTAAATGHPRLIKACDDVAARLCAAQESDGYLGTELPENRFRPSWPVWMHWLATKGLREHGRRRGNQESLDAAIRAGEWVLRTYAPITGPESLLFAGDGSSEMARDAKRWPGRLVEDKRGTLSILDELAELYWLTGEQAYLDLGAAASAHYPPMQKMRANGKAQLMHGYSVMTYLGGAARIAHARGDTEELSWIQSVWDDLATNHLFPTASTTIGEGLETPPSDLPDGKLQETCATVEWLIFTHRLYLATGDIRYPNMIDRTVRNALLGAQSRDGRKWTYFTPLRSRKYWFGVGCDCCYFSGPRGIARIPEMLFHTDADGFRIDLLESSTAKLTHGSRPVTLSIQSDYPESGRVRVTIRPDAPANFTIRIRVPQYCTSASVRVNGEPVGAAANAGEYAVLRRTWTDGDVIELSFEPVAWTAVLSDGSAVLMRGVEALAVDQSDNDVDLDELQLPERFELAPAESAPDGRRRYHCTAVTGNERGALLLTPYADAGNAAVGVRHGDAAFRTAFSIERDVRLDHVAVPES